MKILYTQPTSRKYLWNKADFQLVNDQMSDHCTKFLNRHTSDTSVHVLWDAFERLFRIPQIHTQNIFKESLKNPLDYILHQTTI